MDGLSSLAPHLDSCLRCLARCAFSSIQDQASGAGRILRPFAFRGRCSLRSDYPLHQIFAARATNTLDTEERLQEMADNIQEIVWMIDAETKQALYVNAAYETITGRSCQSLLENPSSYEDLIHPEDRVHVLTKLGEATQTGHFDERFRIARADGEVRWVTVHGFPARDDAGRIYRLVGTAQDITALKEAEEKIAKHLAAAESARAESDALCKATLALTADLRMDFVLDKLLQSLLELVPGECARVLLLEGDTQLLVAREKLRHEVPEEGSGLSTDPRRSRLPVPLAHIDDPE